MVMMPMPRCFYTLAVLVLLGSTSAVAQSTHDGRLFDQGVGMTSPAEGAPAPLADVAAMRGTWAVDLQTFPTDSTSHTARCRADVTFMNRGHALMERMQCADFDGQGHPLHTMAFFSYNGAAQQWEWGEANSHTEQITLHSGQRMGEKLRLHNARRPGGSATLAYYRMSLALPTSDGLQATHETSTDGGETWTTDWIKTYQPLSEGSIDTADGYGTPADDRVEAANGFDFLIGTWDAAQAITFPNGQVARFPSNATAVYAMGGHAILEHSWYDIDTSLPDAATSIIRLYNQAAHRWESLYMTNRGGSGQLYFGGRQDGDQIVLHLFDVNTASASFPRFVFFDIEEDTYRWYAESSTDRGATFTQTWTIDMTRRKEDGMP